MAPGDTMTDAERQKAKALARWEGEGGALGPPSEAEQRFDETELRILSRQGAAFAAQSPCRRT